MKTCGNMCYIDLESGGYAVADDWWVEDKSLAGWTCRLNDGTAELLDCGKYGRLTLKKGFRNDGGSFIAVDTQDGLEGFAAHDALYRMARQSKLPQEWRPAADALMRKLHVFNDMAWLRAQWLYLGVRIGAASHFKPQPDKESVVKVA